MKTMQKITWCLLAVFLLSALPAMASWQRQWHKIYGYRSDPWKIHYGSKTYTYYWVKVPAGAKTLKVQTGYDNWGSGDCDLYLGYGFKPSTTRYTYRSNSYSNKDWISLTRPRKGMWYLRIRAFKNYKTCLKLRFTT